MNQHPVRNSSFASLFTDRRARSLRASSFDRSGANQDFVRIGPGETYTLLEHEGPGCLRHLYCALVLPDVRDYRHAVLRCYWDGSPTPSVQVPLGDFFGISHGRVREFTSQLLAVNPGMPSSHGLNAYFPMPFDAGARVTLENRGPEPFGGLSGAFWYHIDYEAYADPLPGDVQRFHAVYRQERPTVALGDGPANQQFNDEPNTDGAGNYVALDTTGAGRMVGLHLQVDNTAGPVWYGEGDDMVFIDGERWPPSIHGTGSEEIFGGGASPKRGYAGPYTGFHLVESERYDGCVGMYRWYVHDPIHFSSSLRWTVEHGHGNNFAVDYASVAYWYQSPLADLEPLPDATSTLPRLDGYDEAWDALRAARAESLRTGRGHDVVGAAAGALYSGDFAAALGRLASPLDR